MKYVVTFGTLWIAGQKYKRGDIIELSDEAAKQNGVRIQPFVEPPKPKPVRKSRKKVEVELPPYEVSDEDS